jgi:hypothetical protein
LLFPKRGCCDNINIQDINNLRVIANFEKNTMSLKSLAKTRWKMEANRVTVYPYGLSYILTAVLALIFAAVLVVYLNYENTSITASLPLVLLLLLVVVLFWGFAGTYVEFDNGSGIMQKKLFGFIPVSTIPFDKLHGINVVSNMGGGYKYRLFLKDDRYGKGILVSSGYGKNNDANAISFVEEVVPVIHSYLDQHDLSVTAVKEPISSYQYFTLQAARYTIKNNPVFSTIMGLAFIFLGIHELTPGAWLEFNGTAGKIFIIGFLLFIGLIFINAAFTKIIFDQAAQTIRRNSPFGIGNKSYTFQDFAGIQTVRKSVNFVYAGTEVHMHFKSPGVNKQQILVVSAFKKGRNVERFIEELYSIMQLNLKGAEG